MDENEKLYHAGFNSGYLLSQYEPELAEKILDAARKENNEYCIGLSEEHDTGLLNKTFEKNKDHEKDNFRDMPNKSKEDKERKR